MIPFVFALLVQAAGSPDIALPIGTGAGIGGLSLAGVIFYFYRQERANSQVLTQRAFEALEANTAAMTKLTTAIEALVGARAAQDAPR